MKIVNVLDFGANPNDASVDDTKAIQDAINHASQQIH